VSAREWDAESYDRISDPQVRWASPVLDRLRPEGVDVVVDAGCGTGRVTEMLLDRLPGTQVIAVDGSQRMLDEAARRLSAAVDAGRLRFVRADLAKPLPLDEAVDAIVSTATFHWVLDHDALFANLAAVLRAGGQLVAQCGGAGNVASVVAVLRELGERWTPWYFPTAEQARSQLEDAGFVDVDTWLHDERATFDSRADLEEFLATVVLGAHVSRLPEIERQPLVSTVAAALPSLTVDYVRLNMVARR
jgi:trans-aconitate 2-methyltransferase